MFIQYVHRLSVTGSRSRKSECALKGTCQVELRSWRASYIHQSSTIRYSKHHLMSAGIACFAWSKGKISFVLDAAALAAFCSLSDFNLRRYAKRTTNKISILNFHQHSDLLVYRKPTYLSFVIMSKPCTRIPLVICGAMPLNNAKGPSCSMMYDMTSVKLLKRLPSLAGGGRDWRPTLATISGCVAMVAKAFDAAPKTMKALTSQPL